MRKVVFAICVCLMQFNHASAQRMLGVANSNFDALGSMYINPAYLAGSYEKFAINLASVNVAVDNNLGKLASISDVNKILNGSDSNVLNNLFQINNSGKFSMMIPSVDIKGPAIMYRINSRHTVALSTRVRVFNELNNFEQSLFKVVTDPDYAKTGSLGFNSSKFNWTTSIWSEVGASYGAVIIDEDMYQLKGGFTLKYLLGAGFIGLKGNNLNVTYRTGSDTVFASNTDMEFSSNAQSATDAAKSGISASNLFSGNTLGKGWGIDAGIIFMHRDLSDKLEERGYKWLAQLAITDLGSMTYKGANDVSIKGNGYLTGNGIADNVKNYEDLKTYALSKGFSVDTGAKDTKVYLPTALTAGGDYHVYRWFYANALLIMNLGSTANFGSLYYSQITVTPRFDTKLITAGLPITYNMLSSSMKVGLGLRIYGLYFGSDDMLGFFGARPYGVNFYFGGMIPLYKKPTKRKY